MALALHAPFHSLPLGSGFLAAIKTAFLALAREDLTPEQQEQAALIRGLVDAFGGYILEAGSREDLMVRVDTLIEDPAFHQALSESYGEEASRLDSTWVDELPSVTARGENYHAAFGEALGVAALPHLRELHKCMLALGGYFQMFGRLVSEIHKETERPSGESSTVPSAQSTDPLWFLSAPGVPMPVARALLAGVRCSAFVIAAWAATVHPVDGWLGLAIAERWAAEAREFLVLFVSLFKTEEYLDLVPTNKRFDVQALDASVKAIREAYSRFHASAERSGEPVYPSAS